MTPPPTNGLYAVPAALLFRAWSGAEGGKPRRLLLKNTTGAPLVYRLEPPSHPGFSLDSGGFGVLSPSAGLSLSASLVREALGEDEEVHTEVRVITSQGILHVPLVALRTREAPAAGMPSERRSALTEHIEWPLPNEVESARRRDEEAAALSKMSLGGPPAPVECVTAAPVSEQDELEFYAELMRSGPPRALPTAPRASAAAGLRIRTTEAAGAVGPPSLSSPLGSPYDEVVELEGEEGGGATRRSPPAGMRSDLSTSRCRMVEIGADGAAVGGWSHTAPLMSASGTSQPAPPAVSATPYAGEEELAFYQSILSRGGNTATARPSGGAAAPTASQMAARKALRQGTYFVVDGLVCDSRGKELGPASEILGEEHAPRACVKDSGAAAALAAPSDLLALNHLSPRRRSLSPLSSPSSSPRSPVKGAGAAGTMRGGGYKVMSSAPKGQVLTDEQMQANWDALC